MPYVMVPVPEEHVQEAMEAVLRIVNRAKLSDWDAEAIQQLFAEVDEPSRALLSIVARATLAEKQLSQVAASDAIQLSQREVLGIMRDINDTAREAQRPTLLFTRRVSETLANGRTRETTVLTIGRAEAELISAADRADLASGPNPLSGIEG